MTVTNTVKPAVTGTARQGQTLHTSDGTWTFDLDYLTFAYQWERCDAGGGGCVDIAGAVASSYLLTAADLGATIRSRVDATEHSYPGGGTVRDASPGQALSVIAASAPGDTVRLIGGQHPYFTLDRSFAEPRVTITCQAGSSVVGVDTGGQAGYIFDHCTFQRPVNFSDLDNTTFYIHGNSSRIRCTSCLFSGGNTTVKAYNSVQGGIHDIEIRDSEITGGGEDLFWGGGIRDSIFDHNYFHDVVVQAGHHQDGIQFDDQGADNMIISRNIITTPAALDINSQGMMLNKTRDSLIVNNLVHHQGGGRGINVAGGSRNLKIVNNTVQDIPNQSGDGVSLSLYSGQDGAVSGCEVWNNIFQMVFTSGGTYTFFDTNWFTTGSGQGGNAYTGDPLFVDHASYELQGGSPARSHGLVRSGTPSVDLDGNARSGVAPVVLGCRI